MSMRIVVGATAVLGLSLATAQLLAHDEHAVVPAASLALAAFAFVLGTAFFEGRRARVAGAATALAGMLFGVYLVAVQLVVLDLVLDALAVACILRLNPDRVYGLSRRSVFGGRPSLGEKTEGDHAWPPIPRT
jgi:hypothetical protein